MNWKIAEAKQRFSEVVKAAEGEPQFIFNRDRLVAAVVEPEVFQEFLVWQREGERRTLADSFAELRKICAEENYTLEIPAREDRPNIFVDDDRRPPLRHKHSG
jgi:antitoxin (DNA-binding transcriptional repressor) of toxin-antitoxin stability system